jgi:membrane dipeptidase
MLIIDSHLDLSWNALGWNRDLRWSLAEMRSAESQMGTRGRRTNTISFGEMRRGKIGICLATLLARANPKASNESLYPAIDYRSQELACAVAQGQLAYYRLLEEDGVCRIVGDLAALERSYAEWTAASGEPPFGFIIAMEGADPILRPSLVERWWRDGLRVIGISHYGPSAHGYGTGGDGPLTPKGRDLLRAMEETGMILDLTHSADQSFWEALALFKGPVLASHNNCRALVPGDRQYSDDQVRAIVERDGVIGSVLDAWMLVPGWKITAPNTCTLAMVADQMDHICQLAGNARHVAIGSDLDGGYGTEQTPTDLDSIADLQKLTGILRDRGYREADIQGIFHGNWMRFFRRAWGGRG